jgi:hypothetical protein
MRPRVSGWKPGCAAVAGTAEPDPGYPGLWLLPLCEDCYKRLSETDPDFAHDTIHLANR